MIEEILAVAKSVASGRAEVKHHKGHKGHRAIQVYSCFPDEARVICHDIADAIRPLVTAEGYPAVRQQAGIALVWWR
jgi:hypothetical protein